MKKWTALLAALLLALAVGCASAQKEEDEGLKLWFPTQPAQGGRQLASALDTCPYEGENRTIPGLLFALLDGPEAEELGLVSAFPAGTRVLGWSLENRVASVELSSAYAELVGMDLTLADYCIALTLTQVPGVDGVRVTASGGGQSYREGRVLSPRDVLFSGAEEVPVNVTAALYFRREGGDSLGYELRVFQLTQDSVPAKAVLSALIAGPEERGLAALLPPELTVRSAWIEGGVCGADLSGQLLELPEEERTLAVASIENTLRSLDTVEQVQLYIEGEPLASGAAAQPSPSQPADKP